MYRLKRAAGDTAAQVIGHEGIKGSALDFGIVVHRPCEGSAPNGFLVGYPALELALLNVAIIVYRIDKHSARNRAFIF